MPVGAAERQESAALRPEPRGDRSWIGRRYTLLRPYAATTTPRPDRPSLPRDRVALRAARRAANIAGPGQARHERHPVAVQVRGSEKQLSAETSATGPPKPPRRSLHAMPAGGPPVTIYPLRRAARWEAKVLGLLGDHEAMRHVRAHWSVDLQIKAVRSQAAVPRPGSGTRPWLPRSPVGKKSAIT